MVCMSSKDLEEVFRELGISQYLDAFIDQGFDTWDTILDITESDLDALGVKLGHRRRLQRRIANARGVAPDAALVSPTRTGTEDARNDVHRPDTQVASTSDTRDGGTATVQKRKYRRHPKHDENAPERPPSAYVLFSNKMRADIKDQNLTFTEIAKLVGEHWQTVPQAEKEPYERQAQAAKEKYNQDLAEYKKTPEYRKYTQYLQEFRAKHPQSSQDKEVVNKRVRLSDPDPNENNGVYNTVMPTDKEVAKRVRLSNASANEINGVCKPVARNSHAGSAGEHDGEPPTRRQRIQSTVSNGEPYHASSILSASQRSPGEESSAISPPNGYFERRQEQSPPFCVSPPDNFNQPASNTLRREPISANGEPGAPSRQLPPLSDVIDGRPLSNGTSLLASETPTPTFGLLSRGHQSGSPAPTPSLASSETRPPSLRKEQSSAGSMSSGSSYSSYPRTPIEGPLPIHALLSSGKPFGPYDSAYAANAATHHRSLSPDERGVSVHYSPERALSDPTTAGHHLPPVNGFYPHASLPNITTNGMSVHPAHPFGYGEGTTTLPPVSMAVNGSSVPSSGNAPGLTLRPGIKAESGLDGISALLQADKIADRHSG